MSLPDLAAAVTNAGAIGGYGVSPEPPPVVEARVADLAALGADLVIAQGSSAGGQSCNQTIPTLTLVRRVRAQVPGEALVLAAGGVADGLSLVAALDPAGSESVLRIRSLQPAADIVADIVAEAERVIAGRAKRDE